MPAIPKLAYVGVIGFTVFIAFIEMIISAILVSSYNRSEYPTTHLRDVIRFTLFVSIWNIALGGAFIFFLLALGTSIIASVASNAAFLFITWIFWLASGASTANGLGGALSCSNATFAHCHQLLAMEAFAWINFIIYSVAFLFIGFIGYRASKKGEGFTGPVDV